MTLIPEELYNKLMAKSTSPVVGEKKKKATKLPITDAHLAEAEQRMEDAANASNVPDDVKRKHVQQEFHRVH